jgi:hypothetical protein
MSKISWLTDVWVAGRLSVADAWTPRGQPGFMAGKIKKIINPVRSALELF